ncbi:hypothetical protein SAMN02800687_0085 [Curtobacterium sp. UNCCL20]|nr:hypothetical protein SAMN02800687_0085 [Curtobacterium sp. UNCCL20]
MPRQPQPLPSSFANTPFRVQDALRAGVRKDRLLRRDLVVPARGVRLPALHDEPIRRLIAIGLLLRGDQHLSHVTAAALWSCPLPRSVGEPDALVHVHVSTVGKGPVERRTGMVGHRVAVDRASVTSVLGTAVSSPAATWYECRTVLTERDMVVLGDHMIGVGRLTTREQLAGTIRRGDRGITSARSALDRIRVGAESRRETIMRLVVTDAGFPEPQLTVNVHAADGRFIGRVDMAWPELRIALEYDGDHHRTDRSAFERDRARGNDFTVEGWIVIRTTAVDVRRTASFLEQLRRAFENALQRHDGSTAPR